MGGIRGRQSINGTVWRMKKRGRKEDAALFETLKERMRDRMRSPESAA
jgi:hypothetical protein